MNLPTCRVCYSYCCPSDLVLNPCSCKGSLKYTCTDCSSEWWMEDVKRKRRPKCFVCKTKYSDTFMDRKTLILSVSIPLALWFQSNWLDAFLFGDQCYFILFHILSSYYIRTLRLEEVLYKPACYTVLLSLFWSCFWYWDQEVCCRYEYDPSVYCMGENAFRLLFT